MCGFLNWGSAFLSLGILSALSFFTSRLPLVASKWFSYCSIPPPVTEIEFTRTQGRLHVPARKTFFLGLPDVGVFSVLSCLLFTGGVSLGVDPTPSVLESPRSRGVCTCLSSTPDLSLNLWWRGPGLCDRKVPEAVLVRRLNAITEDNAGACIRFFLSLGGCDREPCQDPTGRQFLFHFSHSHVHPHTRLYSQHLFTGARIILCLSSRSLVSS